VWNGSTRDGNGLDGSVTGDLVMIMGEIVVELCDECKDREVGQSVAEEEQKQDAEHSTLRPSSSVHVQDIRAAARLISLLASQGDNVKAKTGCSQCIKFLQARFVKNANGTDMNLQKEALRSRREYMNKRRNEMSSIISGGLNHFVIGSGPYM
jgi:hypothetical protein